MDDNEMNLKVIRNLLKLSAIVPDVADSGEAALEKLRTGRYDLVLLDHMMPHVDGIETLHRAKEEGLIGAATTVIALTANAVVGAREAYLEEGFDDYLSKPVEITALERVLRKYLPESRLEQKPGAEQRKEKAGPEQKAAESGGWSEESTVQSLKEMEEEIFEFYPEEEGNADGTGMTVREFSAVSGELESMGIKVSDGLSYCGGEEDFYLEILMDYVTTAQDKKNELEEAIRAKDYETYGIKVHALKGVSKTIGDVRIYAAALALEMAAKEGRESDVTRQHPELMKEFEQNVERIREILKAR